MVAKTSLPVDSHMHVMNSLVVILETDTVLRAIPIRLYLLLFQSFSDCATESLPLCFRRWIIAMFDIWDRTGLERNRRSGGGGFLHRTCSTASYPAGDVEAVQAGKLSVQEALCAMLKKEI